MERTFDSSGVPSRLSALQIRAWSEIAGVSLRRTEFRILRSLDNVYLKVMLK